MTEDTRIRLDTLKPGDKFKHFDTGITFTVSERKNLRHSESVEVHIGNHHTIHHGEDLVHKL